MGPRALVQIEGAKELRRTLKAAGVGVGDLKNVHQQVGLIVAGAGRSEAPVGTGRTGTAGRLRNSVRAAKMVSGATVRAGSAAVPYAGPIHWGWPKRNIEAQPFLTEAAQGTEPRWIALYEDEIDRILSNVRGA
jgi:hypothetical protein